MADGVQQLPRNKRYQRRLEELKRIRAPWDTVACDIDEVILPGAVRLHVEDKNRGDRRDLMIYDDTGGESLTVLAAGLLSGATSPARPWFAFRHPNEESNRDQQMRIWMSEARDAVLDILHRSYAYRHLFQVYEDVGALGTACLFVEPDPENVIQFHVIPWGQYSLQQDSRGRVDTFFREFSMSIEQVVRRFGIENVSERTKRAYENYNYDREIAVCHVVQPRRDRDYTARDNRSMPYESCYFERGVEDDKLLRESGYERFPVMAPRWSVRGGDVYGYGCGRRALGMVRALQQEQFRKAQGIDYMTDPPLWVPQSLKDRDVDRLPGGVNFGDGGGPNAKVQSLFDVNLRLDHLLADIEDVRAAIRRAFHADVFKLISSISDTTQRTAAEVAVRQEEKFNILAPVYTRLEGELFRPLVELAFYYGLDAGVIPPPPDEVLESGFDIRFESVLAQAQRAINTTSVDRFVQSMQIVASAKPEVLDKFDVDEWVDDYADMLGVPPRMIVPTDDVREIRRARDAAAAAKDQAEQMQANAATAKDLSAATAASPDLMSNYSGYNAPPAQAY